VRGGGITDRSTTSLKGRKKKDDRGGITHGFFFKLEGLRVKTKGSLGGDETSARTESRSGTTRKLASQTGKASELARGVVGHI